MTWSPIGERAVFTLLLAHDHQKVSAHINMFFLWTMCCFFGYFKVAWVIPTSFISNKVPLTNTKINNTRWHQQQQQLCWSFDWIFAYLMAVRISLVSNSTCDIHTETYKIWNMPKQSRSVCNSFHQNFYTDATWLYYETLLSCDKNITYNIRITIMDNTHTNRLFAY